MRKHIISLFCLLIPIVGFSQQSGKKIVGHEELVSWNKIRNTGISENGKWVHYRLVADEGDPTLVVVNTDTKAEKRFPRVKKAGMSFDGETLIFLTTPYQDSVKNLKRKKTKKEDLPKDTLYIHNLAAGTSRTIANVSSFEVPEKWNGALLYQPDWELPKKDSTSKTKLPKENDDNGKNHPCQNN